MATRILDRWFSATYSSSHETITFHDLTQVAKDLRQDPRFYSKSTGYHCRDFDQEIAEQLTELHYHENRAPSNDEALCIAIKRCSNYNWQFDRNTQTE